MQQLRQRHRDLITQGRTRIDTHEGHRIRGDAQVDTEQIGIPGHPQGSHRAAVRPTESSHRCPDQRRTRSPTNTKRTKSP